MLKGPRHCYNSITALASYYLITLTEAELEKLPVMYEILGPFVNTLTADDKYSPCNHLMMICGWTTLTSQRPLENDHKRQQISQIRHEKCQVV